MTLQRSFLFLIPQNMLSFVSSSESFCHDYPQRIWYEATLGTDISMVTLTLMNASRDCGSNMKGPFLSHIPLSISHSAHTHM